MCLRRMTCLHREMRCAHLASVGSSMPNALIAANKPFSMIAYPNRTHGISEGANTSRHLYETMTRYLQTNLPPGPR